MSSNARERRQHGRISISRPAKIYDPRARKYISATTCDLSTHGLLLEISRPVTLRPGDEVFVGIAMNDRQGVLAQKELTEAVVVRAMQRADDHTTLAVKLVGEHEQETAWPRMAA